MIDFARDPGPGDLAVDWHAGWPSAKHDPAPEIQVHSHDPHTVILRQNMSVHFEAPFMYLLFGNDRALLLDTGATAEPEYFPLRRVVDEQIEGWLSRNPRDGYELVVAHTHAHGDHRAADGQFADRPDTTVVGTGVSEVIEFFGLTGWPERAAGFDLGGRIVDVIPGPGHQEAATVFYDRYTRLLLTGDTVLPGMLYVRDWDAYRATIERLIAFCADRPVRHVLGCHVEMTTTPEEEYPRGWNHQPDEAPLPMTVAHLDQVIAALDEVDRRPGDHRYDDFIVSYQGT